MALYFTHCTDSAPACRTCGGTIATYDVQTYVVVVQCIGCRAHDYFARPLKIEDDSTAVDVRMAHELARELSNAIAMEAR